MVTITSFSFQETNTALVLATTHTRALILPSLSLQPCAEHTLSSHKRTTNFLEATVLLSHLHFNFVAIMQAQKSTFQDCFNSQKQGWRLKSGKVIKTPTGILAR